ncbi:MAG: hypothetical protein AAF357_11495 [Verrucomicrobiota bacterium]
MSNRIPPAAQKKSSSAGCAALCLLGLFATLFLVFLPGSFVFLLIIALGIGAFIGSIKTISGGRPGLGVVLLLATLALGFLSLVVLLVSRIEPSPAIQEIKQSQGDLWIEQAENPQWIE